MSETKNDDKGGQLMGDYFGGSPSFFDNQLLSYKQAARYLGISEPYLRRLKSEGQIKFVQIGCRGVRFRVASLDSWIEEREVG